MRQDWLRHNLEGRRTEFLHASWNKVCTGQWCPWKNLGHAHASSQFETGYELTKDSRSFLLDQFQDMLFFCVRLMHTSLDEVITNDAAEIAELSQMMDVANKIMRGCDERRCDGISHNNRYCHQRQ